MGREGWGGIKGGSRSLAHVSLLDMSSLKAEIVPYVFFPILITSPTIATQ